jgi:hypothetical protein
MSGQDLLRILALEWIAYYRGRTTLRVNVLPEDVAQAVLHFASPGRSGRSTGISSTTW